MEPDDLEGLEGDSIVKAQRADRDVDYEVSIYPNGQIEAWAKMHLPPTAGVMEAAQFTAEVLREMADKLVPRKPSRKKANRHGT